MWPMANAMVKTVKPNASEIPSVPIPLPASTAAPQPPRTSQKVPINSARDRFIKLTIILLLFFELP
jgi:hypothetical protein